MGDVCYPPYLVEDLVVASCLDNRPPFKEASCLDNLPLEEASCLGIPSVEAHALLETSSEDTSSASSLVGILPSDTHQHHVASHPVVDLVVEAN